MNKKEYSTFNSKEPLNTFNYSKQSVKTLVQPPSYQSAVFPEVPLPRNSEHEFKKFVYNLTPRLESELPPGMKSSKSPKSSKSSKSPKSKKSPKIKTKKILPSTDTTTNLLTGLQSLMPTIVPLNTPKPKEKFENYESIQNPYETQFEYFGNNELFSNINKKDDRDNCASGICSLNRTEPQYGSEYGYKDNVPKSVERRSAEDVYNVSKDPFHYDNKRELFSHIDETKIVDNCESKFCSINKTDGSETSDKVDAPSFIQRRSAEFEYSVGKMPRHSGVYKKDFIPVKNDLVVEPKYGSFAPLDEIGNQTLGEKIDKNVEKMTNFSMLNNVQIKESCENGFCMLPKRNGQYEDLYSYESKFGFSAPSFKAGRSKGFKPLTPTSNKPIHSKERRPIDNPLIVEPRYGIFAPIEKVAPKKITAVKSIVDVKKASPKPVKKASPKPVVPVKKSSPKPANAIPVAKVKPVEKQGAIPVVPLNKK